MLDDESADLFGKLFAGIADRTAQLNNQVIETYKAQAEARAEALDKIRGIIYELQYEVPRSSEGGEMIRDIIYILRNVQ